MTQMISRAFLCYCFLVLCLHNCYGQQTTGKWTELDKSISTGNVQQMEDACKQLVIHEGVDLRILLSALKANGVSMTGKAVAGLLSDYNDHKRYFFKTKSHFHQVDSLYTAAYLFHQNKMMELEGKLKDYELKPLIVYNNNCQTKYRNADRAGYGYYAYLLDWINDPGKTEDDIIISFVSKHGIKIDKLLSYKELANLFPTGVEAIKGFDTGYQERLTKYAMLAVDYEEKNDIEQALKYHDSALRLNSTFSGHHYMKAKRLAVHSRLREDYLYFHNTYSGRHLDDNAYHDTGFAISQSKEDKAFVKNMLREPQSLHLKTDSLPVISWDALMLSNRFAELHDFGANIAYSKPLLPVNKDRKANLYVYYVTASFTEFPDALRFYGRKSSVFDYNIYFSTYYITLHLLQYNLRGQRIDDAVVRYYFDALAQLVKMKLFSVEDYYWALDCYATGIKHQPSQYGWRLQSKRPYEDIHEETAVTIKNREALHLLPDRYIDK